MILAEVVFVQHLRTFLAGFAEEKFTIFKGEAFLCNLLQSLMNFHINKAIEVLIFKTDIKNHSKMRSPVKSNSTVGITLVMNLRKINSAK